MITPKPNILGKIGAGTRSGLYRRFLSHRDNLGDLPTFAVSLGRRREVCRPDPSGGGNDSELLFKTMRSGEKKRRREGRDKYGETIPFTTDLEGRPGSCVVSSVERNKQSAEVRLAGLAVHFGVDGTEPYFSRQFMPRIDFGSSCHHHPFAFSEPPPEIPDFRALVITIVRRKTATTLLSVKNKNENNKEKLNEGGQNEILTINK